MALIKGSNLFRQDKPYQPHEAIHCAHVAEYYRWLRDQPDGDRLPNQIFMSAYWSWSKGLRPYGF